MLYCRQRPAHLPGRSNHLNILGIPYEHVNENQYSHQWCRVQIDDSYWIRDAFGLYCGEEPAPYEHSYC